MPIMYVNMQVLPLKTKRQGGPGFIGQEGYKKLFTELSRLVDKAREEKKLHELGHRLKRSEYYLVFDSVKVQPDLAFGTLVRYNKVRQVDDFYTGEELFSESDGKAGVSSKRKFMFVFDFNKHVMAIQGSGFPSVLALEDALTNIFQQPLHNTFKTHSFNCHVLTEANSYSELFVAKSIKRVEVKLTFSNPNNALKGSARKIEKELQSRGVHSMEYKESGGEEGYIDGLSDFTKAYIELASRWGHAKARYIDPATSKLKSYFSKDHPVEERSIRITKNMKEGDIISKIKQTITSAWNRASNKDV